MLLPEGWIVVVLVVNMNAHSCMIQALAPILHGDQDIVEGSLLAVQRSHCGQIAAFGINVEVPAMFLGNYEIVQLPETTPVRIAGGDLQVENEGSLT